MRYQCPRCADYWEAEPKDNTLPRCPRCSAPLRPVSIEATTALPMPVRPNAPPVIYPPPAFSPFSLGIDPRDYIEEKVEDLRERRQYRREQQQYAREDRVSNPIAIAGLAINSTAFLLVMSGLMFGRGLLGYGWFSAIMSIPMVLLGLPLCLVGGLRQGRVRMYAWIGTGLGAMLLLLMIPGLLLILIKPGR